MLKPHLLYQEHVIGDLNARENRAGFRSAFPGGLGLELIGQKRMVRQGNVAYEMKAPGCNVCQQVFRVNFFSCFMGGPLDEKEWWGK